MVLYVCTQLFFPVDATVYPNICLRSIFPGGRSTQSSNTAVLGLTSGQRIWVSCDEGHVFGAQGFRGTTFAGAFLYWKWLLLNCPMAPYLKIWRQVPVNLELNENKPFGNYQVMFIVCGRTGHVSMQYTF